MIVGLEGKVERKEPTFLHINVNGIIYEVFTSINCSSSITTETIKINTTHIIKEESSSLYGFTDTNEQKLFNTVIKINGVGPKVALAICSTFTPTTFSQIVTDKNVDMLKRVPGIGPKGASRILVELSGFVVDGEASSDPLIGNKNEAAMALESLGFKKDVITKALNGCNGTTTGDLVKEALKKLQK
ncbi:MAG: Holliday junction branch migration protein RuvA [Campylobacteraceae bacterium]|nr:Holliday junction branch migration protein RuvA [Campylobacteraceae bacterium]